MYWDQPCSPLVGEILQDWEKGLLLVTEKIIRNVKIFVYLPDRVVQQPHKLGGVSKSKTVMNISKIYKHCVYCNHLSPCCRHHDCVHAYVGANV